MSKKGVGILFFVVLLAAGAAWGTWFRSRPSPPTPPLPDLTGSDPEVVEAVNEAREQVLRQPNDARAWGRLGMILRAHDFSAEANRCLSEAERLNPHEPRWPYLQGLTLLLTDPDAGIPCLQRAVERCDDDPLAPRLRLAEALLERGRLEEAQAHLERARRVQSDSQRVQLGLGRLALLRRQWAKAAEYLEISAGDEHARKQSLTLLAKVWTRLNKPEKAQAAQRQAEQAPEDVRWPDPFVAEVLRLRSGLRFRLEAAGALFGERNYSESIRLLQETVKRYPESTTARLQLGDTWQQLGRWTEAEHEFREAVRIDPEAGEAWFRLGCVQARNKSREAVESFRQAIRRKPDHALAHFNLAVRLRELGDSAGAVHEFRETLRCRPDYAPAREELRRWENSKK